MLLTTVHQLRGQNYTRSRRHCESLWPVCGGLSRIGGLCIRSITCLTVVRTVNVLKSNFISLNFLGNIANPINRPQSVDKLIVIGVTNSLWDRLRFCLRRYFLSLIAALRCSIMFLMLFIFVSLIKFKLLSCFSEM